VVVGDVKPLRLPILVGVDELVREVLLRGVFSHLDPGSPHYSRIVGAGLGLHSEEFSKQDEDGPVYKMAPEITKTYNFQAFINTAALVMIVVLLSAVVLKLYCS
jgi:hypothetical protein